MNSVKPYTLETRLVQLGVGFDDRTGAISMPIHPSATYRHPGVGESTGYDYTRSGNPTRQVLEAGLAELEGGVRGLVFSSGMAALTTFFLHFCQPYGHPWDFTGWYGYRASDNPTCVV